MIRKIDTYAASPQDKAGKRVLEMKKMSDSEEDPFMTGSSRQIVKETAEDLRIAKLRKEISKPDSPSFSGSTAKKPTAKSLKKPSANSNPDNDGAGSTMKRPAAKSPETPSASSSLDSSTELRSLYS